MSIAEKIIRGSHLRRSRFHDEKGHFAGWGNIVRHGGLAFGTGALRTWLGYRPVIPWVPYSVIRRLRSFLGRESSVLEYGSGMSTIWYATIVSRVCSVEDDQVWYERIADLIERRQLNNVTYHLAASADEYCSFMADNPRRYDLIVVDGSWRSRCMAEAINLLLPGGVLYLDTSDQDSTVQGGDMRLAEQRMRTFADARGLEIEEFTDFSPTQCFVHQGLVVQLPGEHKR